MAVTTSITSAFSSGLLRVLGSARLVLLIYVINLAATIVPALVLYQAIEDSIATSQMSEQLRVGFDDEWFREFSAGASGLARTFDPSVTGIGALLNGFDAWLNGRMWSGFGGLVGIGVLYLLVWTVISPGVIRHLAGHGPLSLQEIGANAGRFLTRFLRLAVIGLLFYWALYRGLLPVLDSGVESLTRNVIDERVAFGWTCIKYAIFVLGLVSVNVVLEYARILTATEDRSSVIGALLDSFGFVRTRILAVYGLYALLAAVSVLGVLIYWVVAPSPNQSSWFAIIAAFLVGQAYIIVRIGIRFWFLASQAALVGPSSVE